MPSKLPDYSVLIGASAGGLNATTELVTQLTDNINASVFIVLHLSKLGGRLFSPQATKVYDLYLEDSR